MAEQQEYQEDQEQQERQQRKWNTRPESTIAQNFALDLDSMFGLGASAGIDTLSRTVEEKKYSVSSGEQTLQELEARLRETEERLAKVSRQSSPARAPGIDTDAAPRAHNRESKSPLSQQPTYPADRPPTAGASHAQPMRATSSRPPIPGSISDAAAKHHYGGGSDYVMVDRNDGQAQRSYG